MADPTFSIVVPTFRRPASLRQTLAALLTLDYDRSRYEVIVVDDGADQVTDEVVGGLRDGSVEITLESQRQRGVATARNRGARVARGELLLFCDDDIVVDQRHLRRHVATRERYVDPIVNGAWEFAPQTLSALEATPFGRFRIDLERRFQEEAMGAARGDGRVEMPMLGSWNLVLRRDLYWQLGGFDEEFPVAGAEDQDFSLRARTAGCLLLLDTEIRLMHNDDRLSLRSYCAREERNAQTMPFLARRWPAEFGEVRYVQENRPIRRGDPPRLLMTKAAKAVLASRPVLAALHRVTTLLEQARVRDEVLRRLYTGLLGLHLFRGFRRTWS
jgi:GT2 family glycosyltransferase